MKSNNELFNDYFKNECHNLSEMREEMITKTMLKLEYAFRDKDIQITRFFTDPNELWKHLSTNINDVDKWVITTVEYQD